MQLQFTTESPSVHLCECGCGHHTKLAPQTRTARGWIKGQPKRFLGNHRAFPRLSVADRFWKKVNKNGPIPMHRPDLGPCWLWTASQKMGYGQLSVGGRDGMDFAHRIGCRLQVGPIPQGLEIDHLCRTRTCVRASHLEPVTKRVNILRGFSVAAQHARQTHCSEGHPFSGDNLYVRPNGKRECRTCQTRRRRN